MAPHKQRPGQSVRQFASGLLTVNFYWILFLSNSRRVFVEATHLVRPVGSRVRKQKTNGSGPPERRLRGEKDEEEGVRGWGLLVFRQKNDYVDVVLWRRGESVVNACLLQTQV